ncbi:MAG TPA: hypothetical protein VI893_07360 [Thermoplasmata archaeon]|nr:hypothetical protein [Thermoplasmata archaeon]
MGARKLMLMLVILAASTAHFVPASANHLLCPDENEFQGTVMVGGQITASTTVMSGHFLFFDQQSQAIQESYISGWSSGTGAHLRVYRSTDNVVFVCDEWDAVKVFGERSVTFTGPRRDIHLIDTTGVPQPDPWRGSLVTH